MNLFLCVEALISFYIHYVFGVPLFFIYVGVNTSTRKYEDIACRSWEYLHTWIDFRNLLMKQIESSYKQCNVYNDIHIDVCFEFQNGEINIQQNTKYAARKTQIDRQEEKKTYTHDIDSWRQANREGLCVRETEAIIGKAPRLGIHTPSPYQQLGVSRANVLWEEYLGNTIEQKFFFSRCVEGVIVGWRVREVSAGMSR